MKRKVLMMLLIASVCLTACGKQAEDPKEENDTEYDVNGRYGEDDESVDNSAAEIASDYSSAVNSAEISDEEIEEMDKAIDELESWKPDCDTGAAGSYIGHDYDTNIVDDFESYGYNSEATEKFMSDLFALEFDMFKSQYTSGKNYAISPYSALNSLACVFNGSIDTTSNLARRSFAQYFENGGTANPNYIEAGFNCLNKKFKSENEFTFYNALGTTCNLRSEYQPFINAYNTKVLDISSGNTKDIINSYINGLVYRVSYSSIGEIDNTILASEGMFSDDWATPSENYVKDITFNNLDGTTKEAKYFVLSGDTYVASDANADVYIKDFASGRYKIMLIEPDNIGTYVNSLDYSKFKAFIDAASAKDMDLFIPSFKASTEFSVKDMLVGKGYTSPFDASAEFYTYTSDDMNIDEVVHASYFTLTGRGAWSYDSNSVKVTKSKAGTDANDYVIDKPFIYIVYDDDNFVPVMMGTVTQL